MKRTAATLIALCALGAGTLSYHPRDYVRKLSHYMNTASTHNPNPYNPLPSNNKTPLSLNNILQNERLPISLRVLDEDDYKLKKQGESYDTKKRAQISNKQEHFSDKLSKTLDEFYRNPSIGIIETLIVSLAKYDLFLDKKSVEFSPFEGIYTGNIIIPNDKTGIEFILNNPTSDTLELTLPFPLRHLQSRYVGIDFYFLRDQVSNISIIIGNKQNDGTLRGDYRISIKDSEINIYQFYSNDVDIGIQRSLINNLAPYLFAHALLEQIRLKLDFPHPNIPPK